MIDKNNADKKLFWDVDLKDIDAKKNSSFIIGRILEYGDVNDVKWMLKNFKIARIKQVLFKKKDLSPKSANYWALILRVPKSKILCLKTSYRKMRKSHWPY